MKLNITIEKLKEFLESDKETILIEIYKKRSPVITMVKDSFWYKEKSFPNTDRVLSKDVCKYQEKIEAKEFNKKEVVDLIQNFGVE